MTLTALMRDTLTRASHQPLRLTRTAGPGADRPPAPWPTLHALVRHGFASVRELRNRRGEIVVEWVATDLGVEVLRPILVVRRERPVFLARQPQLSGPIPNRTDYTSNPSRAVDNAEVLAEPDPRWLTAAAERRAALEDRRARARRLAQTRRIR